MVVPLRSRHRYKQRRESLHEPDHTIAAMLDAPQADAVQHQLVQGHRGVASAEYLWRRATAMMGRVDCGSWQRGT